MLLGRVSRVISLALTLSFSLIQIESAEAQQCPQGFVDTLVSAEGSGCAGMCGWQCWMVGSSISITSPVINIFGNTTQMLTDEAKSEAMNACNQDLVQKWTAQALRCSQICSASNPPCAAELAPINWTPCEASCDASTVVCDPAGWLIKKLDANYPNRVECDASGSAIVSCNCLGAESETNFPSNQ